MNPSNKPLPPPLPDDDADDDWPRAPGKPDPAAPKESRHEGPLESLGQAVSETVREAAEPEDKRQTGKR